MVQKQFGGSVAKAFRGVVGHPERDESAEPDSLGPCQLIHECRTHDLALSFEQALPIENKREQHRSETVCSDFHGRRQGLLLSCCAVLGLGTSSALTTSRETSSIDDINSVSVFNAATKDDGIERKFVRLISQQSQLLSNAFIRIRSTIKNYEDCSVNFF